MCYMGHMYTKTLFPIYLIFTFIWGSCVLSGNPNNPCQNFALSVDMPILFKKQKQANQNHLLPLWKLHLQNKCEDLTVI